MKKLLTLLLILPLLAGAQVYDSAGFVKVKPIIVTVRDTIRINVPSPPVTIRDTVYLTTPPVIIRDTIKITRDTTIFRDTCLTGYPEEPGPVDPPPTSGETFAFTVQQRSNWDNISIPFAKAEVWSGQWIASQPYSAADKYFRFSWSMLENGQGQYNFSRFNQEINAAIDKGQKFSFGIMTHYPGAVSPHRLNYDGGYSVYPQYLHNLMQAEPVKDWKASNGAWVPNWNSEAYVTRLLALHKAITNHLNTTSYKGVAYRDAINYIDVRGYGAFGEWHSVDIASQMSQYPAGTRATEAGLKRIIDAHTEGFPDWPLVLLVATFDANRLQNTMNPPGVAAYALRAKNKWGLLGWRRDNWGATDAYLRSYTDQNNITVSGMRLDTAIMNRWKYAPIVGEPCCNANYSDFLAQVERYRPVNIGNGNIPSGNSTINTNVTRAYQKAGHKLTIASGSMKGNTITVNWRNDGITPIYESFNVVYQLRQGSTVVWTSSKPLPWILPGTLTQTETFSGLPTGNYDLHILVENPQRSYPLGVTSSKVATVKL